MIAEPGFEPSCGVMRVTEETTNTLIWIIGLEIGSWNWSNNNAQYILLAPYVYVKYNYLEWWAMCNEQKTKPSVYARHSFGSSCSSFVFFFAACIEYTTLFLSILNISFFLRFLILEGKPIYMMMIHTHMHAV